MISLLRILIFLAFASFVISQTNETQLGFMIIFENLSFDDDDSHHEMWQLFSDFKQRFNKDYESFHEMENRYNIFRSNMIDIINHNRDENNSFKLGMNHFTDLTNTEFREINKLYGFTAPTSKYCDFFKESENSSSKEIDWRVKGAVTSVKDQGQCGSCWTFSATGAIEGAWAIAKQDLMNLSEQELVDCATGFKYGSHGCNGGQMDGAFQFVMDNGQCSDDSYPYVSGETKTGGTCMDDCKSYAKISKCYDVEPNNQMALKTAVSMQPVSVAIEADTFYFQSYSSGILDSPQCGTKLDHGVLIVGYGEENGKMYWLVKNSWSESWGDNGYIKIARSESTNDPGICGIAMQPSFPTI
jgi:C1A family cysteine protease